MPNTLYWHDYETFGSDPRRDRPCQFAGIRTDEDLNVIGDPLVAYCRPAPDFLPDPESCLITGISPLKAEREGLSEAAFCARIIAEFSRPGTCVTGYNSIRFDDEVTRHLLYRCFFDPYEREWKNGNSRWDIIDMLRLAHAVRPRGIRWPRREDGSTSFRLEELSRENGLEHASAHDALSDVLATIEVAKLLRRAQPKLYDWCYRLRFKSAVAPLLDPERREPLLHVSSRYPAARGCLAVVIPLARHPINQNGVIVCDLGPDPAAWLDLDAAELRRRLFTPAADLPEGLERPPLKTVHLNKCPALAPLSVLDDDSRTRWSIDLAACRRHLEALEAVDGLPERIAEVWRAPEDAASPGDDPDLMLYSGGFFDDSDRAAMVRLRALTPAELGAWPNGFHDPRLPEMLFRYRARNFPETLNGDEAARWQRYCRGRLDDAALALHWGNYAERLAALREAHPQRAALLDEIERYARRLGRELGLEVPTEPALDDGSAP